MTQTGVLTLGRNEEGLTTVIQVDREGHPEPDRGQRDLEFRNPRCIDHVRYF
jgi:hypothetical protein